MGAQDNMQPRQLAMFMTARELKEDHTPGDAQLDPDMPPEMQDEFVNEIWDEKDRDNRMPGSSPRAPNMLADVRYNGVSKPVSVSLDPAFTGKRQLMNGHHRVAAAFKVNPDSLLPVHHAEGYHDALWGDKNMQEWGK